MGSVGKARVSGHASLKGKGHRRGGSIEGSKGWRLGAPPSTLSRQKPVPPKDACPLTAEGAGVSSSPVRWSLGQTKKSEVSRPGLASLSVLPVFLVQLFILAVVLLSLFKRQARSHPCPSLAFGEPSTSAHWPSPGTLEVLGKRNDNGKTSPQPQLSNWG